MNTGMERPSDRWVSGGVSVGLHLLALLVLWLAFKGPRQPAMVLFSVETVPGLTTHGEGGGAEGAAAKISNQPASVNPVSAGLRLGATDAPVPAVRPRAPQAPRQVRAPSLSEVSKLDEGLKIGVQPRQPGASDAPSEGGMGDAHQAGTENSPLAPSGDIAGRGYRIGDYSYGKPLPEESEVVVLVTVDPKGEVLQAQIRKTSGYPELDQHALAKSRDIVFDPLPPNVPQENKTGTVSFRFEYTGAAK